MPNDNTKTVVSQEEKIMDKPSFYARLARVQNSIGTIERTSTAEIKTQKGGVIKYDYITLDQILEKLLPLCVANDIAYIQIVEKNERGIDLVTKVVDPLANDEVKIEQHYPLTWDATRPQQQGSAITYARRYSLGGIFQIVAGDDDDGNNATLKSKNNGGQRGQNHQLITSGQLTALKAEFTRTHTNPDPILRKYRLDALERMSSMLAQKLLDQFQKVASWEAIDENQIVKIKAECERTGTNPEDITTAYGVGELAKLSTKQGDSIIARLATKPDQDDTEKFYQGTESITAKVDDTLMKSADASPAT